jgi:hypothetical protein
MRDDLKAIFDSLPPKPPRSRLEPYAELIREMREHGWTYREIANVLAEKCDLRVAASTVYHFVRVYRRAKGRRKSTARVSARPTSINRATATTLKVADTADGGHTEGPNDLRKRIAALKGRQAAVELTGNTFRYDPNEPLRLKQGQGKGKSVE